MKEWMREAAKSMKLSKDLAKLWRIFDSYPEDGKTRLKKFSFFRGKLNSCWRELAKVLQNFFLLLKLLKWKLQRMQFFKIFLLS